MEDGWSALYIAIIKVLCPEQAFELLYNPGLSKTILHELILTPDNLDDIQKLREEMTIDELAEAYGINYNTMRSKLYNKHLKARSKI